MTITHADFLRLLPKALTGLIHDITGNSIRVKLGSGALQIKLAPEGARKSGSLVLPVTHVTFYFENTGEIERRKFIDRFYLAYQKGGG